MEKINEEKNEEYNKFYIYTNINHLKELAKILNNYKIELKSLYEYIKFCLEKEEQLQKSINDFILWLNTKYDNLKKEDKIKNEYLSKFSQNFEEFQKINNNILISLSKLETLNNDFITENKKFNSSQDFSPPKVESLSFENELRKKLHIDSSSSDSKYFYNPNSTPSFIENYFEEKEMEKKENIYEDKDNKEFLECKCCKKKAIIMYKNNYYCSICSEIFENNKKIFKVYKRKINEDMPIKLYNFLNSIVIYIKMMLLKCDSLIKKGSTVQKKYIKEENKLMEIKVTEVVDYPFIKNNYDNNSYLEFIKDIDTLNENYDFKNFNHEDFQISILDDKLIKAIRYILINEKNELFKISIDELDDQYFSSGNELFYITDIQMDKNYITYVSPNLFLNHLKNAKKRKEEKINNNLLKYNKLNNQKKENIIKKESEEKKNHKREKLTLEQIYYLIEYLYDNNKSNKEMEEKIIKKMENFLMHQKNSYFMKYVYNDFLITTERFLKLSINEIVLNFPNSSELYEYKILIDDFIIKKLGLEYYIDCKYNIINASTTCMRIKRDGMNILLPSGWNAFGMKFKVDTDEEWEDMLLGFGENLSQKELMECLKNSMVNRLIKIENQSEKDLSKNEYNKLMESKIYFDKRISIVEAHSGIISFYENNYRILLMVKIKKKLLELPVNINLQNLSKDIIRIQSILLKKIQY